MGCSEARPAPRLSLFHSVLGFALAVSPATFAADPPPGTQHETKKPYTNRLAMETSPYLLLHAHNPVDWRPWGPDALLAAKDANKPIFLSVGYSSCYWCHVMEREVFENEEIAAYINENFICIKVDREERPDIDDQYMLALQLYFQAVGSPQGGGWPMSMFLTPDAKPFAGGTYFPAEDKENQPGFRTVAEQVQTLWTTREADLRNNADVLASAVKRYSQPGLSLETVELDESLVSSAVGALLANHDPIHGGFFDPEALSGPKFPSFPNLNLWSQWHQDADDLDDQTRKRLDLTRQALDLTLTRMAMGGIRDHLGGGFHRYSVDREWRVPHFEKMLYDQALIAEAYLQAYERTQNPLYKQVAQETLDFVLRELTSPEGGFYAALDAETDGIEGQYYVWSREEIESVLGADDAKLFAAAYGLDQESRFEHGHVLHLPRPLEQTARELRVPVEQLESRLATMREKLLSVRSARPALLRDDKILASWNGLMIRTLAQAGGLDGAERYLEAAERASAFLLNNMRDDEGRLLHSYAGGKAAIMPYLDDYAYVVSGLLQLSGSGVAGGADWQQAARSLMDDQFVLFWDARGSGFWFTSDDHEPLLARIKDANDSVLPNPNAVSVSNLVQISHSLELIGYLEPAGETLQLFAAALKNSPSSTPGMANALHLYLNVAPTVPPAAEETAPVEQQLALADADPLIPAAEATDVDIKRNDKLSAVAYLSHEKVPAGGECYIAVVLDVHKDWHINANPAQPDYLNATKLTGTLPGEMTLSDVRYPAGHDLQQKGLDEPLKVYEGRVILYGRIKAPAAAAGKSVGAEFTVSYQCCDDTTCLAPKKLVLTGSLSVAAAGEQPTPINKSLFKRREK